MCNLENEIVTVAIGKPFTSENTISWTNIVENSIHPTRGLCRKWCLVSTQQLWRPRWRPVLDCLPQNSCFCDGSSGNILIRKNSNTIFSSYRTQDLITYLSSEATKSCWKAPWPWGSKGCASIGSNGNIHSIVTWINLKGHIRSNLCPLGLCLQDTICS